MKVILIAFFIAAALSGCGDSWSQTAPLSTVSDGSSSAYFSPGAVALSPDGATLVVAGATANELAFLDLRQHEIVRRVEVPASPSGLVLSTDGSRIYVTCAAPESRVQVIAADSGKPLTSIPCGHTAMAPVLSRDEKTLFVCNRFNNDVGIIDLVRCKEVCRIPVEREPVAAALTPDSRLLFVANHLHKGPADVGVVAASVTVIDTATRKVIKTIPLTNGSALLRGLCVSPGGRYVAVVHTLGRFHLPTTHVDHGWMNDNALSLIDVTNLKLANTVLLDDLDRGAANPWAVAWSGDGQTICVTHAGTHELSIINAPALLAKLLSLPLRIENPSPADYSTARIVSDVPNDLAFLVGLRTRVRLPGNGPRGLALSGNQAYVGLYFSDSLAVVNLPRARDSSAGSGVGEITSISLSSNSVPVPGSCRAGGPRWGQSNRMYSRAPVLPEQHPAQPVLVQVAVAAIWPWRTVCYRVDFDYIGPGGAPVVFRTERFIPEWEWPWWCPWAAKARA